MRALADEKENFEVPLTPLIDVVFLLLIFFLVATTFNHKEMDNQIQLPEATGGSKALFKRDNLIVNVRKNGFLVILGRVVPEAELSGILKQWKDENPGMKVLLRGDGQVEYNRVMRVMGICRSNGVDKIDLPIYDTTK